MGLILLGPFSFAQISRPIQQNAEIEEVHDTNKLNKVLQDYNKDQQKVLQDAEMIKEMETTGEVSDEELGKGKMIDPDNEKALEQAHEMLGSSLGMMKNEKKKDLKKIKYSEAIRTTLAPLQKLSEKELSDMLKENTKGTAAGTYVERFPKMMTIAVRLIKDPEAIPGVVRTVDDQDKLIRFAGLMIATILVGFFLKRLMAKEGRGVLASLGYWFLRSLIMFGLRVGIIVFFYSEELTPAFKVVSRSIF